LQNWNSIVNITQILDNCIKCNCTRNSN
jgi:hypothetical protein